MADATKDGGSAGRRALIEAARSVVRPRTLREDFTAGSVGAALRTAGGDVHTGVCIDLASGLGFCAEVAAVAAMVTAGETRIESVVAVGRDGVLTPCGRCRETIAQLDPANLECRVVLGPDRDVALRELLPRHWLEERGAS